MKDKLQKKIANLLSTEKPFIYYIESLHVFCVIPEYVSTEVI